MTTEQRTEAISAQTSHTTQHSDTETAIRKRALRRGYRIHKARGEEHGNNRGAFKLVLEYYNEVVLGTDYDASLTEISAFLNDIEAGRRTWRGAVIAQ